MKHILHKCISANQSAFVPGRSIIDNAMIAIEVVHHMKVSRRVKDKYVALKLDTNKAYGHSDWLYLKDVMVKMGFADQLYLVGGCDKAIPCPLISSFYVH